MKILVLFSGGLDSTTCLAKACAKVGKENVKALSLYYGQKHEKEMQCAEKLAEYYGVERMVFDVKKIFEESKCTLIQGNGEIPEGTYEEQLKEASTVSTYVPFRNGLFISVATCIALAEGFDVIWYGAHKDDAAGNAYPDCSQEFNKAMGEAIYLGSGCFTRLEAPFIDLNKADVVKEGLALNVPYELTWSCYKGGDKPCGKCGTCIDRIEAFRKNGKEDPLYE